MQTRDRDILVTLTKFVRVLTLGQAARTWWGGTKTPESNARRGLAKLTERDLITATTALARPELQLTQPVVTWTPNRPVPAFDAVAYALQSRWVAALRPTRIYVATKAAANAFGGHGGRLSHPMQVSHDLHISTVYLRFRLADPATAACWISEQRLVQFRRLQKLPDAAIGESPESPRLVIEFGNGYDADRLRAFHADCAERSIGYEIW